MKIELTIEQFDFLLGLLSYNVQILEHQAAALGGLEGGAAQALAQERLDASQNAAELVTLLSQYEEEGDHA